MSSGKIIPFDNVLNVRDFGGQTAVINGQNTPDRVSHGKLYRGAQISELSAQDQNAMADMGISLVVDCRFAPERARQASAFGGGFNPEVLEVFLEHEKKSDNLAPHEAFAQNELYTAADARRYMMGSYRDRPHNPAFVSLYGRALKRMAAKGETVYVHCAAGKDRTGTFVALFLQLMGVSQGDILHDYLLTREATEFDDIKHAAAKRMEDRYGRPFDPEALEPYFGVYPEYLDQSYEMMGNPHDYARDTLGLTSQDIAALQGHYGDGLAG